MIIAPIHKGFWDAFFIGVVTPRHTRFMGNNERLPAPKRRPPPRWWRRRTRGRR